MEWAYLRLQGWLANSGTTASGTVVMPVAQGGGGGGVAQLVVVPLAMGRGAKSPGFDSHRGLSFQKGREDKWIGLNPPPGVHGSSPSYASGRLTV